MIIGRVGVKRMVETIEVGICPKCGVLISSRKLEEIINSDGSWPGEDDIECPSCKTISPKYNWEFKDFLVD